MTFLPIVSRELRVRSRRRATYWARVSGGAVVTLIGAFVLCLHQLMSVPPGRLGMGMFGVLSWLAFLFCLLEGGRQTADCLSSEKRGGTLGLLFLTDLKGYDVVLGKWMAGSLNSIYVLVAVMPVLGLPLLMGGVTGGEFWRLILVLLSTLLLSLNVGMLVSAVSRSERRAFWSTIAVMGWLAVSPPLLGWLPWPNLGVSAWTSPSRAFGAAGHFAYARQPQQYWKSLLGVQVLGWGALVAAGILLPHAWQDRPARTAGARAGRERAAGARVGARIRRRRKEWLERNPVLWLAGRTERQQFWLWLLVLSAGALALCLAILLRNVRGTGPVLLMGAFGCHTALTIWAAFQASYLVPEARRSGELELLLATPLTDKEILEGYLLSLKQMFLRPVAVLVGIEGIVGLVFLTSLKFKAGDWVGAWMLGGMIALMLISFIFDLYTACYFGIWMGTRQRHAKQAFTRTALFVVILPLGFITCCSLLWPVMAVVKDFILLNYARDALRRQLRSRLTEPLGAASRFEGSD